MKVLITGSAGFIGYFVSLEFLKNGYHVIGIDNLNNYYEPSLKKFRLEKLNKYPNYQHLNIDLSIKNQLIKLEKILKTEKVSITIHLAAYPGVKYSLKHPQKYIKNNIITTQNLFEIINKLPNIEKQVILASTSSVYTGNPLPFKEDSCIKEFLSPYAMTKFCAENIAKFFHSIHNFKIIILRYFTVYGPYNRPDMAIYKFFQNILQNKPITIRGKEIKRDFTYVEDASKATFNAAKLLDQNQIFEIINIGSDNPIKVTNLLDIMFQLTQKETKVIIGPYSKFEPPETWADTTKAKKLLNFNPSINYHQNLLKTLNSLLEYWQYLNKKEIIEKQQNVLSEK